MPVIKNLLNNGLAEVDDELAKTLIESGNWVAAEKKAPAKKAAPVKPEVAGE